jgi:hypothetical protein
MGFDREGRPRPQPIAKCVCVDLTSEDIIKWGLEVRERYGPC